MRGVGRLRAVTVAALTSVVVTAVATTAWAAPVTPTLVKDEPGFTNETAPVSVGPWFGWQREEMVMDGPPAQFLVEREGRRAVTINAPGTTVEGGAGIVGSSVFYTQLRRNTTPRLMRYDLRSGTRTAMPDAVNRARFNNRPTTIAGDVSADGPWLLFTRDVGLGGRPDNIENQQIVLYHRGTRRARVLNNVNTFDFKNTSAAQVNGDYATWTTIGATTGNVTYGSVTRRNIRTGRTTTVSYRNNLDVDLPDSLRAPAVAEDGTLYFWRSRQVSEEPYDAEKSLVRLPLGGPRQVVTTLSGHSPSETFVRDRADGTHRVFYSYDGDIFRLDP